MSSLQMKLTKLIMKKYGSKIGNPKDGKIDYSLMRKVMEDAQSKMPTIKGVHFEKHLYNNVEFEIATPDRTISDNLIFYIHGGGFSVGNINTSRGYASLLSKESGMRVATISYRLAPENPFPSGIEDCLDVYQFLSTKFPTAKVSFIGESAGGNLAIVLSLIAMKKHLPLPSAIVAYSPITDFTNSLPSRITNHKWDITIGKDIDKEMQHIYFPNHNANEPLISPLRSNDLCHFPPTMLVADIKETLYDDSAYFAQKLKSNGVYCEFYTYTGTFHAFPIVGKKVPEGKEVLKNTLRFINRSCF